MSSRTYRIAKLAPGHDLGAFDCGESTYNEWLTGDAARAVNSGSAVVYVLLEAEAVGGNDRVVGYFAICPTLVVRDHMPKALQRGMLRSAPGWLLAKLALDTSLRGDRSTQWGRQLLREALLTIIAAADVGGGQIIVVDPDNAGLVQWYAGSGFQPTGGPGLRMYMKLATARSHLLP